MSKLDELINQLCPDGVEYAKLEDCCSFEKGKTPIQKATPGDYPLVVTTSERRTSDEYQFDAPTVCVPLISSRGHGVASLNEVYYQDGKFALGNILCGITPNNRQELSALYLTHYLNYKKDVLIVPLMRGGANVSLSIDSLKKIRVPVPPLVIQNEICRIISIFLSYKNVLETELASRKKQYEYYSQQLLLSIDAESVPISDLGKWMGGKTPSMNNKQYWEGGIIPWISSKDMKAAVLSDTQDHITEHAVNDASMTVFPAGTVAIVTRSGILKHTFPVVYVPFETTINQDIKALKVNEGVSARYVSLAMQAFSEDIRKKTKKQGGTVDSLEFSKVLSYKIPLPSYEKQLEIVGILERFDSLCNSLSNGLPAEIDARQKQYEFYRDKLLTFKEKAIS